MRRVLSLAALLAALPAYAQFPPGPDAEGVVRVALDLSPAEPPVPAGRWNLYPEYRDQQPGTKVQGLLRSFMEQQVFFNGENELKRQNFLQMSLADLPADVREQCGVHIGMTYPGKYSSFLANADKAARYTRTEWNEWHDLRKEGINYLLPEVQKLRALAAPLALRLRGETKNAEWPRAVETVKSLWGISQALEQHPTLIGNLVAIAIFQIGLNGVEEMVGQPDCPSLYWALAAVPALPVDTRHGLGGERVFLTAQFQPVLDARRPMSDAELAPHLAAMAELADSADPKREDPAVARLAANQQKYYTDVLADPARLAAARGRLLARGWRAKEAVGLPAAQLGLLNDLLAYEEVRDELFKWYPLPAAQALPGMAAADKALKQHPEAGVFNQFVAAAVKVKTAETRIVQRTALLRAVEMVRLHLGAKGQLPATLADTGLPEPTDPYTGKPFAYTLQDGVATLRGANAHPDAARPFVVEYTLKVRK